MNITWWNKHYMVIWIPTFTLTALPKYWKLGEVKNEWCLKTIHYQFKRSFEFPFQDIAKMVRSSKILISAKKCQCNLTLSIKQKETWYAKIWRLYKISSEKQDIENKQKITFLLVSEKKNPLISGIRTYYLWISNYFSKILPVKSVLHTADVSKNFLAI